MSHKTKHKQLSEAPFLFTKNCDCGNPECTTVMIGIVNPQMKESVDGKLIPVAYLPGESVRGLIEWLERYADEHGL